MIDTVVFDIGNVLAAFDWPGFIRGFGFSPKAEKEIAEAVFKSNEWKQVDLGLKSDEELIGLFTANAPQWAEEIRAIFEKWQYSVVEYPFAEGWVKELKAQGLKVYILSNYGRTMFEYARNKFKFLRHIDGGVVSYQINKIKPDPDIYRTLIEKYDLEPDRAVFLDDLPDNINAAAALGFNTILVTNHDAAAAELEKLL
ncbi:MAG: HAD family phosphatase [Oscillospiraceae bacterium]|nr:HAD family phosphatase [Oscillospiraceae bacterium]